MATLEVRGGGIRQFENAVRALGSRAKARRAFSLAINDTGRKVGTKVGRALADQTGLPKSTTKKAVTKFTERATVNRLEYTINGKGGRISLKHFKPRETRKGVSATPGGSRQVFPGTFMKAGWWPNRVEKPGWNGQVFTRVGYKFNLAPNHPDVASGRANRKRTKSMFEKKRSDVTIPNEIVQGQAAAEFRKGAQMLSARIDHVVVQMGKGAISRGRR